MSDEMIDVLIIGERTPEQIRYRLGMIGTILSASLLYGCVLGVFLC